MYEKSCLLLILLRIFKAIKIGSFIPCLQTNTITDCLKKIIYKDMSMYVIALNKRKYLEYIFALYVLVLMKKLTSATYKLWLSSKETNLIPKQKLIEL